MDEDGEDLGNGKGKQTESLPTGPAMGPIYLMWENTLDKLKILDYERLFCQIQGKHQSYSRIHFVIPAKNTSSQLDDFFDLCQWLIGEISHSTEVLHRDQYDDPNTTINKLLLALRQLDFKATFPSQKLRSGYGEQVCLVLEFLVDKALDTRGFKFSSPIYVDNTQIEQPQLDDDEDDEIEDEAIGNNDDDAIFEDANRQDMNEISLDNSNHQILQAAIDPIEWKIELERVGPKLKAQQQLSLHEWRAHVDQTLDSKSEIEKYLSDTMKDLTIMNKVVLDETSRARTKEKYLSVQFAGLCEEFSKVKQRVEELEQVSMKSNERLSVLNNTYTELNDKFDELKELIDSKDSGINDTSPLVRIKAALQQIKSEISVFDLRIGVVANSLLSARVDIARKKLITMQRNRKKRNVNNNRKINYDKKDHYDDDSLLSDD